MTLERYEEELLRDTVDIHVHTTPDYTPRLMDDIEVATEAHAKGMRALVLKGHVCHTADRAFLAHKVVPGIQLFGGVVLNDPVGGLNPAAVDASIRMGGKVVWMPTMWAKNHVDHARVHPSRGYITQKMPFPEVGLTVLRADGTLKPEVVEILDLCVQGRQALSCGHLGLAESLAVVTEARRMGVRHVWVSHPEYEPLNFSVADQRRLADAGALIEHVMACHLPFWFPEDRARYWSPAQIWEAVEAVGAERTILSSDLGMLHGPTPADGFRQFIQTFQSLGAGRRELDLMTRELPARVLEL